MKIHLDTDLGGDTDYNIQLDIQSAQYVLEHSRPTLIPMTMTCQTALRRAYLPGLAQAGKMGELLVRQAEACAKAYRNEETYGWLHEIPHPGGMPTRVVTNIDASAFNEYWYRIICA